MITMCRLLGLLADRPVDLAFSLLDAPDSIQDQGWRNLHGWGIAGPPVFRTEDDLRRLELPDACSPM
jgi:hypothetical protein